MKIPPHTLFNIASVSGSAHSPPQPGVPADAVDIIRTRQRLDLFILIMAARETLEERLRMLEALQEALFAAPDWPSYEERRHPLATYKMEPKPGLIPVSPERAYKLALCDIIMGYDSSMLLARCWFHPL